MNADADVLRKKFNSLEDDLAAQRLQHQKDVSSIRGDLEELRQLTKQLDDRNQHLDVVGNGAGGADFLSRHIDWTISDYTSREAAIRKGESIWSPKFRAAGIEDMQLEIFPKGRENTTNDGFCSLFLWCPPGTKIKYQLWVGKFVRAPDEDEYTSRHGHGHSNFCPLEPEIDMVNNCLRLGVDFLETMRSEDLGNRGMRTFTRSLETMVAKEAEIIHNQHINKVVWKIREFKNRAKQFPRGTSMWSRLFSAAGIKEILLEFYPNGSAYTTKDGYCAFYVRCPEGVSMTVTLFVGRTKKGPIMTTFDGLTGKGLPNFCPILEEIDGATDSVDVGIEIAARPSTKLMLES